MIFGFLLCDEIDHDAACPEPHQACCVVKMRGPPQQQQMPQQQKDNEKVSLSLLLGSGQRSEVRCHCVLLL
jgi:hypothetical protein